MDHLIQREMDAAAIKGGASPLSTLEADMQGTRAALLAAMADDFQEEGEGSDDE